MENFANMAQNKDIQKVILIILVLENNKYNYGFSVA